MTGPSEPVETALGFPCANEWLQGVLAAPAAHAPAPVQGVVILVGGPQYRVGSHRQFVQLARRLARDGHAVLRFDMRGMGDSTGEAPGFDACVPDIGAAVDALCRAAPTVRTVALWGLCDGASAALLYLDATRDARVRALCLLNPWVRSEQSLAQTRVKHYYRDRLLQPAFWRKLLRGGVGLSALREAAGQLRRLWQPAAASAGTLSYQDRMERGWTAFDGTLCVVLSGRDWTAREFDDHVRARPSWSVAGRSPAVQWHALEEADHTFSDPRASQQVETLTLQWLRLAAAS
nr:hydrolase 1, exosortase A system-associated [Variovorax boronicumulans]